MDVFGNVCIVAIVMQMSTDPTPKDQAQSKSEGDGKRLVYRRLCVHVQLVADANGQKGIIYLFPSFFILFVFLEI